MKVQHLFLYILVYVMLRCSITGNVVNANFGGLTHKETQHTAYKDRVAQLILDSKERKVLYHMFYY